MTLQELLNEEREEGRKEGLEEGRNEGFEKGRNEGFEKGRNEGFEKGRNEGRLSLLSQLVNDGALTIEQAARMTNLSVEELQTAMKTFEENHLE